LFTSYLKIHGKHIKPRDSRHHWPRYSIVRAKRLTSHLALIMLISKKLAMEGNKPITPISVFKMPRHLWLICKSASYSAFQKTQLLSKNFTSKKITPKEKGGDFLIIFISFGFVKVPC
jgi:hypothetical protein